MSLYYAIGSPTLDLSADDLRAGLFEALENSANGRRFSRFRPILRAIIPAPENSLVTPAIYGDALTDVMPALGTHVAMSKAEAETMFGDMPQSLIRVHNWRDGIVTLGEVLAEFIHEQSEGKLTSPGPRRWAAWWPKADTI